MGYRGIAMTIAGSDSGGGAGIEADLATFLHLHVFGTVAITAVTAQNSNGVHGVFDIPPDGVRAQIDAVLKDFSVGAVKTGMLSREETILEVAKALSEYNCRKLVVDPVMVAQSGDSLIFGDAVKALVEKLLPLAFIVTPNIPEAQILSGITVKSSEDMKKAAKAISKLGPQSVLVKGGHLEEKQLVDLFYYEGEFYTFTHEKIDTLDHHGTGCTLSAAITAELSANTETVEAVKRAIDYTRLGIEHRFRGGKGYGCVGHIFDIDWLRED